MSDIDLTPGEHKIFFLKCSVVHLDRLSFYDYIVGNKPVPFGFTCNSLDIVFDSVLKTNNNSRIAKVVKNTEDKPELYKKCFLSDGFGKNAFMYDYIGYGPYGTFVMKERDRELLLHEDR